MFKCDEMGLNWRQFPERTLVSGSEKESKGFKKSKDRVTLIACANASGSLACSVTSLQTLNALRRRICQCSINLRKNSWMDSTLFKSWFFDKFVPHCRSSLRSMGLPEKPLLLLEMCCPIVAQKPW